MTFCFLFISQLLIAAYFSINVVLLASAQDPIIFPEGARSLFMGNSFFIPVAAHFDTLTRDTGNYPRHNVTLYRRRGNFGTPLQIWNNITDRKQIESFISSGDTELFGMLASLDEDRDLVIDTYQKWIDLASSYNPKTSFYIGLPHPDYPSTYSANDYRDMIIENGDTFYQVVSQLRDIYPNMNIYYINYGVTAIAMIELFEKGELAASGITTFTRDETSDSSKSSIFSDFRGHQSRMLKDFNSLSYLHWFYGMSPREGSDLLEFKGRPWDMGNSLDIYREFMNINEEYRLYQ